MSSNKKNIVNKILSSDLEEVLVERKETGLSGKLKNIHRLNGGQSDMTVQEVNKNSANKVKNGTRPFLSRNNSQGSSLSGK